jgi:hypothetical protein
MTNPTDDLLKELLGQKRTPEQEKALADAKKAALEATAILIARHTSIALAAKSLRTLLRRLGYDVTYRQMYQALFTVYAVIGAVRPLNMKGTKLRPFVTTTVSATAKKGNN